MGIFNAIINLFRRKKSTEAVKEEKKVTGPVSAQPSINAVSPQPGKSPDKEQPQDRKNSPGNYNKQPQGQKNAGASGKYRYKRRYYNRPKNKPLSTNPKNTQQQSPRPRNNNPPKPMSNEPESKK